MNILCVREHTIENGKSKIKTVDTFDLTIVVSVLATIIGDDIPALCIQTITDVIYYNDSDTACYDISFSS